MGVLPTCPPRTTVPFTPLWEPGWATCAGRRRMSGGMSLPGGLGGILGNLLGGPGGGRNGALAGVLLGLLSRQGGSGGLGALVQRLRDGGLDEQAQSWVDTGRNQPVSGKELTDALGEDEMVRLAGRAGLTKEETAAA